jgi:hypothetical protein
MAGSLPPLIPAAGHCALPDVGPRRGTETHPRRTNVCAAPFGDRQDGTDQGLGVAHSPVDACRYDLHSSQHSVPQSNVHWAEMGSFSGLLRTERHRPV